jgi:hypothetical protein
LVFSTVQAQQASETTKLALLTQINESVTDAGFQLNRTQPLEKLCYAEVVRLSATEYASVRQAISLYDYLAWLINHRHLSLDDVGESFATRLMVGYEYARLALSKEEIARDYPDLLQLRRAMRASIPVCASA